MDKKLLYLTKTLSRTKRKDYENYVINTIWNRVAHPDLIPVSQQFVKAANGNHYMIDLYFPQLNIGIECDEQYHEQQKQNDALREMTIFDVLKQVNSADYRALHVKINNSTTFSDVEKQIDDCVSIIKKELENREIGNGWAQLQINAKDFYKDKKYISIHDNVAFPTNKEVYNNILGKNYKGNYQRVGQTLPDGTYIWFPKLAINGRAVSYGWNNTLTKDGTTIVEYNEDDPQKNTERVSQNMHIGEKRVIFTHVVDPVTKEKSYRFVGVFVGKSYDEKGALSYERIDDKFKIIR